LFDVTAVALMVAIGLIYERGSLWHDSSCALERPVRDNDKGPTTGAETVRSDSLTRTSYGSEKPSAVARGDPPLEL
jgi:hypothetical protein